MTATFLKADSNRLEILALSLLGDINRFSSKSTFCVYEGVGENGQPVQLHLTATDDPDEIINRNSQNTAFVESKNPEAPLMATPEVAAMQAEQVVFDYINAFAVDDPQALARLLETLLSKSARAIEKYTGQVTAIETLIRTANHLALKSSLRKIKISGKLELETIN